MWPLVNPKVVSVSDQMLYEREGCLSIPGFWAMRGRPASATIRALSPQGKETTTYLSGFLARAVLHEIDHLDGVLFTDSLKGAWREDADRYLSALSAGADPSALDSRGYPKADA
jgi:peptide deformylase